MMSDPRLEQLATELAAPLLNYFSRRIDTPADAADLLSETLLVMTRRAQDLPVDDEQVRMWAFGVARRVLSSYRRGSRRHSALVERLREHLLVHHPRAPEISDAESRVQTALDALSPRDREIIRLIHWDGFTQVQVAALLGCPQGTIRSRYARARTTLRGTLGEKTTASSSTRRDVNDSPAVTMW